MPESHAFQAEVAQVLHLVIHSLYSHKEIFLRELISNASDALDRLRFRALTDPALVSDDAPLEIRIVPDKAAGTLTIEDTGIGMTHEDLVRDLGTVARSGSKAFLEQLRARGEGKDLSFIGQFGVGFYSAYLVADRVDVVSRAAGQDQAWRWRSDGKDTFYVDGDSRPTRGTSVILHLKDDQKEFLEDHRLKDLVRPATPRILELNGAHPVVRQLERLVEKDASSPRIDALIEVLLGQALLTEGSPLDDPNRFSQSLTRLLTTET